MWHDFFGKELHRTHHLLMVQTTERKIADKICDTLVLQCLDLGYTGGWSTNNGPVFVQLLVARWS